MFSIKIKSPLLKTFFVKHKIKYWTSNTRYDVIIEDEESDAYFQYEDGVNSVSDVVFVLTLFAEWQDNGAAFVSDVNKNEQKIIDNISEVICDLEHDDFTFKRNPTPVKNDLTDLSDLIHDNVDFYFSDCDWMIEEGVSEEADAEYDAMCAEMAKECVKWLKKNGHTYKAGFFDKESNCELVNDFIMEYIPKKYPGSIPQSEFYEKNKIEECRFVIDNFIEPSVKKEKEVKPALDLKELWSFKTLRGGALLLTGYNGNEPNVIIPSKIDGHKVSALCEGFMSPEYGKLSAKTRWFLEDEFESVYIPDSVKEIGNNAFSFCKNLKTVKTDAKSLEIGEGAFLYCNNLFDENGFIILGNTLVRYQGSKPDVKIPDGVVKISANSFRGNRTIKSVYFPDSVEEIGEYAFESCENLTKIRISNNLKVIDTQPFSWCPLKMVELSDQEIETELEGKLSRLRKSDGPGSVLLYVENDVLYSNDMAISSANIDTTEINIKNGTKVINFYAFRKLKKLKKVVLPETLERIGMAAFSECKQLEEIVIPASVKEVEFAAFDDCSALSKIYFNGASIELASSICNKNKFSIYAPKGSPAENYAKEKNLEFIEK